MEWLSENAAPNDLFATNRIDAQPGTGEGVSCIYTALSGRQAYMEGYTYAVTNMGVAGSGGGGEKSGKRSFFFPRIPLRRRSFVLPVRTGCVIWWFPSNFRAIRFSWFSFRWCTKIRKCRFTGWKIPPARNR